MHCSGKRKAFISLRPRTSTLWTNFRLEDLIVAAFHDVLLQPQDRADEFVCLDHLCGQQLQFCVEIRHSIDREQEQQIQPQQLVHILGFLQQRPAMIMRIALEVNNATFQEKPFHSLVIIVVAFQLGYVSLERRYVLRSHAVFHRNLQYIACN